jgi:hypothetical protein
MELVKGQKICVKFCFKVRKKAAETTICCVNLIVMMPHVKQRPMNGQNISNMVELQRMTSGLAEIQLQDLNI